MKKFLVSLRIPKSLRRQLKPDLITLGEARSVVVVAEVAKKDQLDLFLSFISNLLNYNTNIQAIVLCKSRKLVMPEAKARLFRVDRKDFLWTGALSDKKLQEFPSEADLLINVAPQIDPYILYVIKCINSGLNIAVNGNDFLQSGFYELNFETANGNNPDLLAKEIASYLKSLKG